MKKNLNYFSILIFCMVISCASSKVLSDFDNSVNFTNYKTFDFSAPTDKIPVDDIIKNRILNSISSNLSSKGLQQSVNPDLFVDVDIKTKNKKDYSNTNVNVSTTFGKRWRFRTGVGKTYSKEINYTEGSMIINLVDRRTNQLVWKGSMTDVVKETSSSQESISTAISKILESFPPK